MTLLPLLGEDEPQFHYNYIIYELKNSIMIYYNQVQPKTVIWC